MQPVELQGTDVRTLIAPSTGMKIPVIAARGLIFSAWKPSEPELEKLKSGEPLWLIQRGTVAPEMTMIVATRREVIPDDLSREAMAKPFVKVDEAAKENREKYDRATTIAAWVIRVVWLLSAAGAGVLAIRLLGLRH